VADPAEPLYGTWRLKSWTREFVGTGERFDGYGKAPNGFLTYGRDGRMLALIVRGDRAKPADLTRLTDQAKAALYDSMMSYGGSFSVEGSRVVHRIDISWNEFATDTVQFRNFRVEGRSLTLTMEPSISPVDGREAAAVLTWEKVG